MSENTSTTFNVRPDIATFTFKGEEHTIEGLLFDNQELTAEVARLHEEIEFLSQIRKSQGEMIKRFDSTLVNCGMKQENDRLSAQADMDQEEIARLRESVGRLSTEATEHRELIANFRKALVAILAQ